MGACLIILAVQQGCAVRQPPDPDRLAEGIIAQADTSLPSIEWPSRDPHAAERRIWMQPGRQRLYMSGLQELRGDVRPYVWSGEVQVLGRRPAGLGILCEVRRLDIEPAWYDPRVFLFYSSETSVMTADRRLGPPAPPMDQLDGTPMDGPIYRWRPELPGAAPTRGIAFVLRPLSGGNFIRSSVIELRNRGWLVIETGLNFGIAGIGDKRDAASTEDLERFGRQIARLADDQLSEWTYGCEAMLEFVQSERPELKNKPVIVVGYSAGAIGAPTVAARLRNRVHALVLVGGGVDVLRIASTSSLSNFGLGVKFNGEPVRGESLEILSRAYLNASRMDSYHTAQHLRSIPTLMLHAADDDIVPAGTGQLLYERLGRPERWVLNMGHELLFLAMSAYSSSINDWLDRSLATQSPSTLANAAAGKGSSNTEPESDERQGP